ncbi:hypothetical protein D9M68_439670 [compost metagenome]
MLQHDVLLIYLLFDLLPQTGDLTLQVRDLLDQRVRRGELMTEFSHRLADLAFTPAEFIDLRLHLGDGGVDPIGIRDVGCSEKVALAAQGVDNEFANQPQIDVLQFDSAFRQYGALSVKRGEPELPRQIEPFPLQLYFRLDQSVDSLCL